MIIKKFNKYENLSVKKGDIIYLYLDMLYIFKVQDDFSGPMDFFENKKLKLLKKEKHPFNKVCDYYPKKQDTLPEGYLWFILPENKILIKTNNGWKEITENSLNVNIEKRQNRIIEILHPKIKKVLPNFMFEGRNYIIIEGINFTPATKVSFTNMEYEIVKTEYISNNEIRITLNVLKILNDKGKVVVTNVDSDDYEINLYKEKPISILSDADPFNDKTQVMFLPFNGKSIDLCKPEREVTGYQRFEKSDGIFPESLAPYSRLSFDIKDFENENTITLMCWTKNITTSYNMLWGFRSFDGYILNNKIGINTGQSDLYGCELINSKKWNHITYIINQSNNEVEIYLNGVKQKLKQWYGKTNFKNVKLYKKLCIYGWANNYGYTNWGYTNLFRVFTKKLSQSEIDYIYQKELKEMHNGNL